METLFPPIRPDGTVGRTRRGFIERVWLWLPRGDTLPVADWTRRHRGILILLGAQIVGLTAFALVRNVERSHLAFEMLALAAITGLAAIPRLSRRARAVAASVGLITCSALLTHFSGGYIEA